MTSPTSNNDRKHPAVRKKDAAGSMVVIKDNQSAVSYPPGLQGYNINMQSNLSKTTISPYAMHLYTPTLYSE